jgi:hypothetical protein
MSTRLFVTFESDLPNDEQWDDRERLEVPVGRSVLSLVRSLLTANGARCAEVIQHSFYGWRFVLDYQGQLIALIIQFADPWLIIVEPIRSFWLWVLGSSRRSKVTKFLGMFHELLKSNGHFANVRWHSKKDFKSGARLLGSESPY